MYKKSFVSLSFTQKKLELVWLNNAKKKVLKQASTEIPDGIIQNYKVINPDVLTSLVRDLYKKAGVREKGVGIVVPEFSTYTKTLSLPKLEVKELDEAVRWQMQEFLPEGGAEMNLDWKIIKSTMSEHQVLAVAIPEKVLSGYVEAVEDAGLFPIVVETPSLSLVRVAPNGDEMKLIVYANNGEAVLIFSEGQRIVGSVVAQSQDQSALFKLTSQMVKHYANTPPSKIILGGLDIGQNFYNQLQQEIKLPLEWIKLNIEGLSPSDIQGYLVPLSLQLKDPTEPADETTINLLPTHWAVTYRDKKLKNQIWGLTLISSIVVWICLLAVVGVNLMIQGQLNSHKTEQRKNGEAPADLVSSVTKLNTLSENVVKFGASTNSPFSVINSLVAVKPTDITISKYDVNIEQGKIVLVGKAADRRSLVAFKNALESKKDEFGPITIPISILEQDGEIPFNFEFAYLKATKKPSNGGQLQLKL